ncbi:hypothetical protein ACLQ2R_18815 [Streptosporangium sp. DT93]|uniref:hypothetical protein n=1 Tax=Streptosporangium sp. DT93 TaxID=3393428 RepID=UPI003CF00550
MRPRSAILDVIRRIFDTDVLGVVTGAFTDDTGSVPWQERPVRVQGAGPRDRSRGRGKPGAGRPVRP